MRDVIAFIEHSGATPRRASLEIATKARELAGALGGKARAVVVGRDAAAIAETLKRYPLDAIHVANDGEADEFLLDPSIDYLEAVARASGPALILVPNTMIGRDVGSRIAARLEAGMTS